MRAIGYIRVSTGRQERGTSLASQREAIEAYCDSSGWELDRVCSEIHSAGVRPGALFSWEHRPSLFGILDAAPFDEFDVVVVAAFDRLSRDHASLTILKRSLAQHGVRLASTRETTDDSALSRLLEAQLSLFAEFERDLINERLRLGKARRKAQGRHVHGRVPFGYASRAGELSPIPTEAPTVKAIFRGRARGTTVTRIARELNANGAPTRRGGPWLPSTVAGILRNRVYLGERYGVKKAHPSLVHTRTWNQVNRRSTQSD